MILENGKKMEAYLRKIQTIRGQFPVLCNPNLLACAISDHLESAEGQEMMKSMLMQAVIWLSKQNSYVSR